VRSIRPAVARVPVLVAVAVLALALVAIQLRANAVAAEAEARALAEQQLANDVHSVRETLAAPALEARAGTASLRLLLAETVTGATALDADDRDTLATIDARAGALRTAADRLDTAAATPHPRPSGDLPAEAIDDLVQRLGPVDAQAHATAALLRDAAGDAVATARAAHELHAAVAALAEHTAELPDSDEPEAIAAAWTAEEELRTTYLDAIDAAAELPVLAPLTAVHRDLAERLTSVADEGAKALADGDLDAYNDRLEEQLGALDHEELRDELRDATASSLAAAVAEVEAAEEHALGLLHELDRLRRDTPTLVASR
jgi:hypothetical protein